MLFLLLAFIDFAECTLVLGREDLDELGTRCGPVVQQVTGTLGAGPAAVRFNQGTQLLLVALVVVPDATGHAGHELVVGQHLLQLHAGGIAALGELAVFVIHVSHAAAHARCKVAAGLAQHHHGAAGHVFAAVVTHAFDHGRRAGQTHGKALACHARKEGFTTGGTEHHGVAHNGVAHGLAAELMAGAHDHAAARQALAGVVIGFAGQVQRDALAQEGTKGLAARTFKVDADGVIRQTFGMDLGHRTRQHGTDGTVHIARHVHDAHGLAVLDGRLAALDELDVQCLVQQVVLLFDVETGHFGRHGRLGKQAAEVQALRLPVLHTLAGVQQLGAADQFVKLADTQLGHDLAHFFRDEEKVVHHMLRLAGEFLAQFRVLRGHAHGAGVQMALAHHDAAFHHQRCGRKAELVRTQQRADHHVAAGLDLTVHLHADTTTQAVEHQGLLGFGQADFPGAAGMLDGGPGRGTGATVVTSDHHVVALALGNACGNRAHTDFGHQLHGHIGVWRHVLQVVNQLGQVFDGVDVMVGWWRNQTHAGHGVTLHADVVRHLAAGQLAAFTGLGTLRHLDLDLVGRDQVLGGHTKATGSDLLDLGAQAVTIAQFDVGLDLFLADDGGQGLALLDRDALEFVAVALGVFAAFTGIALAANAVHGHGQRSVGFGRDRTQRHGTGGKALDDFGSGFDFFHRDGLGRIELELEQTAQRHVPLALVVDDLRVFLVGAEVVGAGRMLQLGDRIGRPHVLFATGTPGVFAARVQHGGQHGVVTKGRQVVADGFLGDFKHTDAFHAAGGAGEVFLHRGTVQAHGFEQLGAAVGHVGRHAHLGHDLGQALADGLHIVVDGLVGRQIAGQVLVHVHQGFQRQIGVHGFGTVACQHGEVVHFAGGAGFHDQTGSSAQTFAHQMLVDGRQGQQRRNGDLGGRQMAVADDQDVGAALDLVHGLGAQRGQLGFHAFTAPAQGVGDVNGRALELAVGVLFDLAQLGHALEVEDGLLQLQTHGRVDLVDVQQVGLGAHEGHQRHHNGFADGVDRRVGHLREHLAEVVVQRLVLAGQHGQRAVIAHGANAFFAVLGHGGQQELDVFLRKTKGLLALQQRQLAGLGWHDKVGRHFDLVQLDAQVLDPLLVGLGVDDIGLELVVLNHAPLLQIDQQHLAGLQTPLAHDLAVRHGQYTGFGRQDDQVVLGYDIARGAQAVAVQRGADLATIGEHQRGRAVPGLHHGGVVFIEGAAALVHGFVLLPGLGNHHHHGLADGVARHGQQLQAVVEGSGVGLACEADGVELFQVFAQHRGSHHAFTRHHPVVVAAHGVDFTVVRYIAVGVGQRPLGEGVGRETLVHQTDGRDAALIGQIVVVHAHLVGQQQALVHHGTAAHAGHVILFAVLQAQVLDGGRGGLADHVQLALQCVLHDHVRATADEHLAHDGLFFAHGGRHGHVAVHGHIAPAQQHLAFGLDGTFQLLFTGQAGGMLFGQEDHAHAIFTRRRQLHPLLGHFFAVELVGNLNQDTCTVTHQRVGTHGTTVVNVLEDLQRAQDDVVALLALDVGNKAQSAGIVFVAFGVQAVFLEVCYFCSRGHGSRPRSYIAGTRRLNPCITSCKKI